MARKVSVHKFVDLAEIQYFLDGGIIGGSITSGAYLVGKTLIFTSPVNVTVTFVAATPGPGIDRDPYILLLTDIKAQIEAVIPTVRVAQVGGRIVLVEVDPVSGVALAAAGTAKGMLGYDASGTVVGRIVSAPGGEAPTIFNSYSMSDNMHVIYLEE